MLIMCVCLDAMSMRTSPRTRGTKAKKFIFVGYGDETKGYRLYNPKREKVFYHRDVKFNEAKQARELVPETQHLIEWEYSPAMIT